MVEPWSVGGPPNTHDIFLSDEDHAVRLCRVATLPGPLSWHSPPLKRAINNNLNKTNYLHRNPTRRELGLSIPVLASLPIRSCGEFVSILPYSTDFDPLLLTGAATSTGLFSLPSTI
jgi:hypothetical protein